MPTEQAEEKLRYEALISTPCLLTEEEGFSIFKPGLLATDSTEKIPPPADRHVFGRKMETLFSHYLRQSGRFELILENFQLIKDQITIGEIDFMLKELSTGRILHLEMACKFYLYRDGLSQDPLSSWIGPNGRDRLIDKIAKLRERQFPLLHHPLMASTLEKLAISPNDIHQQLFMPGFLFTPKNQVVNEPLLNPASICGHWLSAAEFMDQDFSKSELAIPAKENWLLHPIHNKEWLDASAGRKIVMQKLEAQRSPMVWTKDSNGRHQRFFVLWW